MIVTFRKFFNRLNDRADPCIKNGYKPYTSQRSSRLLAAHLRREREPMTLEVETAGFVVIYQKQMDGYHRNVLRYLVG